jgi:hypothetical protein
MLRERIPMLSAMTLNLLGAKMKCNKWRQAAGAILACKPERHTRVCSKLLDVLVQQNIREPTRKPGLPAGGIARISQVNECRDELKLPPVACPICNIGTR